MDSLYTLIVLFDYKIVTNDEDFVYAESGVRPSISLKAGFKLVGNGDGSVTNPFKVG